MQHAPKLTVLYPSTLTNPTVVALHAQRCFHVQMPHMAYEMYETRNNEVPQE